MILMIATLTTKLTKINIFIRYFVLNAGDTRKKFVCLSWVVEIKAIV